MENIKYAVNLTSNSCDKNLTTSFKESSACVKVVSWYDSVILQGTLKTIPSLIYRAIWDII